MSGCRSSIPVVASFGALITSAVWAANPVAVWEGFTDEASLTKGAYSWVKSANTTISAGVVTIGDDGGLSLVTPEGSLMRTDRKVTIVMDVESIPASEVVVYDLTVNGAHVSLSANDTTLRQRWNLNGTDYGTLSDFDRSTKHRLAYTFEGRSGVGSTTFVDGVQVMNNTALQSSTGELTELIIGNYNKTSNFATGMRVSKIALFDAKLSAMDVADYFFPSEQTTLSYTEDVSVSQILTDMDGALKATVTIADGKTISVDTAVPSDKALDLSSLYGTITLDVAEGLTFTASKLACTNVVKTGKGAIVFTRDGGYRGCTIADGSASTTTGSGYGAYSAGSDMDGLSTITVGPTATLDVSGSRNSCYIIVSNGGTITNTGDDIPTGNRQTTKLVLNADTVVSGNLWGLRATGGKPSRLETNGHKLIVRMNANKDFILYDCTVTGGGILSLESGSLAPGSNTSIDLSDVEGVGTGTVLVEWAEGVATPTLAGISVVRADGYAVSVDTSVRQIKLVGNVAAIGGTEYPTLAAAVAAATAGDTITLLANCGGAVELTKDVVLSCVLDVDVSAVISGTGALTKAGSGTLTLSGENTFSGAVTVSEGVLKRGHNTAFGDAANRVTVSAGATLDMNNFTNREYPVTLAGAGAEGRPYALTTSSGSLQGNNILLSDDATIGAAGAFNLGKDSVGATITLDGHTLSYVGTITAKNINYGGEGRVKIVSGRYTAYQWNNNGANATLEICAGATYASAVDSDSRCTFRNVINNGTIAMNETRLLRATGTYTGTGTVNNLVLANGATNLVASTAGFMATGRFVQEGDLTVDLSALQVGEGAEVTVVTAPAETAYKVLQVSIVGAEGLWVGSATAGVLKALQVPALATVDGVGYTSVAAAFAAAADGKTVSLLYFSSEPIVVTGNVTVEAAEGAALSGTITGTGSITIPEGVTLVYYQNAAAIEPTVKGAGTLVVTGALGNALPGVAGLNAATWTGTLHLKDMTGKTGMNFAALGNTNSTIRISGVSGWMASAQEIAAEVVLANEGAAYGLNIHDGSSGDANVSTFAKLSGDGKLLADGGSTAGFVIKDGSAFSGAIEASSKTITFGTQKKAGLNKIIVEAGMSATIGEGAAWSASQGIQVDGTLFVEGTTTYDNFTPQAATHGTVGSQVTGAGEVVYVGALPTDAATAGYTNEAWTGSVTIKDFGELDSRGGIPNSGHVRASFPGKAEVESWQNANSRITFKGVKAWVNSGVTYDINLVLEDQLGAADEVIYAWHNDSGGSSSTTVFTKLSGTGTFYDNASCAHVMKFGDCSDFSGAFHVTGKRICIGAEATVPANGGISVASGQSIVAAGQTWRALAGVSLASGAEILYAGGPLTLAADTALTATGTIGVGLKGEVEMGNEMPVLAWNEKPTDVTWEKGETIPSKYFLRATTPALCLRKLLPLVITVR